MTTELSKRATSDTPRTDAETFAPGMGRQSEELVNADFARNLERELSEAQKLFRKATGYTIGEYKQMVAEDQDA